MCRFVLGVLGHLPWWSCGFVLECVRAPFTLRSPVNKSQKPIEQIRTVTETRVDPFFGFRSIEKIMKMNPHTTLVALV